LTSLPPDRVELNRPRDLNALLSDSFALYRRHFWTFLAIGAAVVVPVYAIVFGVGLGQFKGGYDSGVPSAAAPVPILVQILVVDPLVAVMALHALRESAARDAPHAGRSIQAGLDVFAAVFWPVLIALVCEVGTLITVIVPLVLVVRWYFVPQLVLAEGRRGTEALTSSWELTRGFGWRTAGLIVVGRLLYALAGGLLATPLGILAKSVDSSSVSLAATVFGETLVAAPVGIYGALMYFDLQARKSAVA
jgi:uncharacterized membrane protein YhaH (DUF805 family)